MKKTIFRTTAVASVVALLAACGGGGGEDVGSKIVKISFDQPQGVLEAGKLVTVKGNASSSNSKLTSMKWTVSGAGAGTSAPTLINQDCTDVTKGDSSFGEGSSNWSCVLTLQAPKTLAAATTYELGLSASSDKYSGQGSTRIEIKPASKEANQVEVQFGNVPSDIRAGQAVNISGTVSSSASKVSGARWTVVNSGASQHSAFPIPTLENADCSDRAENTNPSGVESSTWSCAVRMIVSPRLASAANYKLTFVGTNSNGFALSKTLDVPVSPALASANKVAVTLGAAPTNVKAGDKITLTGKIKSTNSELDLSKSGFSVTNLTPINALTGPSDYNIVSKCVGATNPTGPAGNEVSCTGTLIVPTSVTIPVTLTYALSGTDDEGFSNYATQDISVDPSTDAFGIRASVSASPSPIVPGEPVNLTCAASGGTGNALYSWRVADSGGTSINLSSATTTTGNATFNAPTPLDETPVVVECGVSYAGGAVTYTPLTIKVPGSTDILGLRASVTATPNPVTPGTTVNLQCTGEGAQSSTNYTYSWRITNANGTASSVDSGTTTTGAAVYIAPPLPLLPPATDPIPVTVSFECAVSDGTRVIKQPLDVIINP